MKKLVLTFGLLIFASVAHAETATYCWHVTQCNNQTDPSLNSSFWMDGCDSTDIHTPDTHYLYENDASYRTKCNTGEAGAALSWATNCARFYNKDYPGYKNNHPLGACW